ncbi:hypothetical protein L1987_66590 [Smallanthus sonchifolius]|uniref:Uncharacterized protein n=1 Tax=Smallanthus sonchifolius TaxID=185202 RepID=A0ACB9BXI6_9ASTR|nr:hypothetical protein L1987_66590 [Smallanthus sonchifolius]
MVDGERLPAMDFMRSEPMQLARIIIPMESAHRAISYLGELGLFQFNDIKRCGEMARKLRFFRDQMHKDGVTSSKLAYGSVITLDELEMGEVFNSAQKKATAQQREQEHRCGEGSIDSPLLLEHVTRLLLDAYVLFADLQVEKNVFIVFHSGERAKSKVLKICDAFGANRYPFTDDVGKQHQMITEVC